MKTSSKKDKILAKDIRKNKNRIIPDTETVQSKTIINQNIPNYTYFKHLFNKKIGHHFKINNKIDEINYRQLMEIKLYSQAQIYKKLFEEFSRNLLIEKNHAQMININKKNEIRKMKLKR